MDSWITLQDLGMAYRKAKVDIYYSSHAVLTEIVEYEKNLYKNLSILRDKFHSQDLNWFQSEEFLGSWILAPKKIDITVNNEGNLIYSSPQEKWKKLCATEDSDVEVEFRLMAQPSMHFQVLASLWIQKVGHKFDALLSDDAYGNRLRRNKNNRFNKFSLGSFRPYLYPYKKWKNNAIETMRNAINEKKRIIAVTADVNSFYHELNPDFMLNKKFLNYLGIELSNEEYKLHRIFINALEEWSKNTPLKKGLPVGLPASAIIANIALIELDRSIKQGLGPIYYGRYVDDIILVMEDNGDLESSQDIWEKIFSSTNHLLKWKKDNKTTVTYVSSFLKNSTIEFSNKKNKVFILEGSYGSTLIDSIEREIYAKSSEWRALPNLPKKAEHIATDIVFATQNDGEKADNLRKTDELTTKRASFALKLRDFEAYERDLPPDSWVEHRHAFFDAFIEHILVLPIFFDLSIYLPRVIRMATVCQDFEYLYRIIKALDDILSEIKKCKLNIKSSSIDIAKEEIFNKWKTSLESQISENIVSAFPVQLASKKKKIWNQLIKDQRELNHLTISYSIDEIQSKHTEFYERDLAHKPFRFKGLPKELIPNGRLPAKYKTNYSKKLEKLLPSKVKSGLEILSDWTHLKKENKIPVGYLFPTRPFNITEVYFIANSPFKKSTANKIAKAIFSLRGYSLTNRLPIKKKNLIKIQHNIKSDKINIALANWKTSDKSWTASVMKYADPDINRYQRLMTLINHLIDNPYDSRYFIMPELSLPARWFIPIAMKMQLRNISFIAGIEYIHSNHSIVHNQIWASLLHTSSDVQFMTIVRQDKQSPAIHEEKEIFRLNNLILQPKQEWENPPIIQHGDFLFSILICSELTNIAYRSYLRGKIDALFVPEWNQDTETFNSLVESSALDMHTYIIQCNDRKYGDSRIRAPYKKSWMRDNVRTKGGINDYYVVGQIDIKKLRAFQSAFRSPKGPFKPVPDGFNLSSKRSYLPLDNDGN